VKFLSQLTDVKATDAGSGDVVDKAQSDIKFSMMRSALSAGNANTADIGSYLDKAHEINDEVDTVAFGLETDDGEIVKVYVNVDQATEFEQAMSQLLGLEDDVENAINELALKFDIVDVVWPAPEDGEPTEDEDEDEALGLDDAADLLGDFDQEDNEQPTTPPTDLEEQTMSIGSKFLQRVTEAKQPTDRTKDGFDIPLDTVARAMESTFVRPLERQLLGALVMAGATGKYLRQFDGSTTIEGAADELRRDATMRRAFLRFFKALATAKGYGVPAEEVAEGKLNEAKLMRGSVLQKILEMVLVRLGMPEELVLTTGPAVIGTSLYRTAKLIDSDSTLETALRNLARVMGVKTSDVAGDMEESPIKEAVGNELDIRAKTQFATNVETILNGFGITKSMFSARGLQELNRLMTAPDVSMTSKNGQLKRFIQTMGFTPIDAETPPNSAPVNSSTNAGTIKR
jgi:hypothetical protein